MFRNRYEAGRMLAAKLKKYKKEDGIILGVPRGGVPVAYAVAAELDFPVELILTKKIGYPGHGEYAIGSVSLRDYFVFPHHHVPEEYIVSEVKNIRARLKEMNQKFMGGKEPENIDGKTVIVIDDGIATGNTLLGTISMMQKSKPRKIVVAAPVASKSAIEKLKQKVDEVVTLIIQEEFRSVGEFYQDFEEVTDKEVMFYLEKLRELKKAS
jgi:putative phosphoribosyl transferase